MQEIVSVEPLPSLFTQPLSQGHCLPTGTQVISCSGPFIICSNATERKELFKIAQEINFRGCHTHAQRSVLWWNRGGQYFLLGEVSVREGAQLLSEESVPLLTGALGKSSDLCCHVPSQLQRPDFAPSFNWQLHCSFSHAQPLLQKHLLV